MKLITYFENGQYRLASKVETIVAKSPMLPEVLFQHGLNVIDKLEPNVDSDISTYPMLYEKDIRFAPIVPNPGKIICVGLNYADHAKESNSELPEYPVLFNKFNNTLAAHKEEIPIRAEWERVDYEAELAVVIGKTASRVSEDEALEYVLGYTIANDLTERRLQSRTSQWMLGKSVDKFLPLGPYLVTPDEVVDPQNLTIRGWLNGELRQESQTSNMIFSVAQIISYISQTMTLYAGDVILTGTPEGVILGYPKEERVWMQAGDEYVIEIEKIGKLRNKLVAAPES
jgi:2-keto-4-pentenoate hydratase/2-oxohepta-3-ene-1,7-dioic acid hydratase in catechol pathway